MNTIPCGSWAIECVLINEETVMNNDGVRALQIQKDEWVIQSNGQRFRIRQASGSSVVLESEGHVYYADFEVDGNKLSLSLSKKNSKKTLSIEAVALSADVFVDTPQS